MFSAEEQYVLEKDGFSTPKKTDNEDGASIQGHQSVDFPEGGLRGWSVVLSACVVTDPFPHLFVLRLRVHAGGYFCSVPSGTYIYAPRSLQSTDKFRSAIRMVMVPIIASPPRFWDQLWLIFMYDVRRLLRSGLPQPKFHFLADKVRRRIHLYNVHRIAYRSRTQLDRQHTTVPWTSTRTRRWKTLRHRLLVRLILSPAQETLLTLIIATP